MRLKFTTLFFLFLIIVKYGKAQKNSDAGMWNTFNLEYKLSPRYTALFTQEFRLHENFSRLNLFYTNIGLEYKILKSLKTALVYRWIDKLIEDNTFSYRHRIIWDLSYKNKLGKVSLTYRHRLQTEKRDIFTSENGKLSEWNSRHKLTAKYNLEKRYIPYLAVEMTYQIHDPRNLATDKSWYRSRYVLGAEYKINARSEISAYYLFQHEFSVAKPQSIYMLGLEYNLFL